MVATLIYSIKYHKIVAYIGADYEDAKASKSPLWVYEAGLYTLLGVSAIGLVRVYGFILEHVLILLPGAIAVSIARGATKALELSILTATASSLAGMALSISLGLSPAGVTGLILFAMFMYTLLARRGWPR